MGSPYLNSGETIILTTNRLIADAVAYDIMLTTERIFLIDDRNARFEPRIIPLSSILSVQGGRTTAHDPVITILFRTSEKVAAQPPLNLVFSQNPNENRKNERDDWMRNLIRLSIATQERDIAAVVPAVREVAGDTGLRPAVRHWVAPEKVRPLSNVVGHQTAPAAPVTVIPDEVEGGVEIPVHAAVKIPVKEEPHAPEPVPEEPATDLIPVRVTSPSIPAPPARVIPQIIEELRPERTRVDMPVEQLPEMETAGEQEKLHRSVQSTIQSLTGIGEPAPEPLPIPEPVPEDETRREQPVAVPPQSVDQPEEEPAPEPPRDLGPGAIPEPVPENKTPPEQPLVIPSNTADQPQEAPESIQEQYTGTEPATTESSDAIPGNVPEAAPEIPPAGVQKIPQLQDTVPVPENVVPEPESNPAPEEVFRREPEAFEAPPIRHPIPPAREIRPRSTMIVYSAVLLLLIALLAASAVLLLPHGYGQPVNQTPTPGIMQVTTLPPQTMPAVTISPDTTMITTSAVPPFLSASQAPQEGVWVRVNSTAYYSGKLGNLERMQPVSGTGDNFYKVIRDDRVVQVSVQKQDNSGAMLAVSIFRDGILISTRSVTSPMGTVDLLIDPITAQPPGLTANDTLPEHAATPAGLENY